MQSLACPRSGRRSEASRSQARLLWARRSGESEADPSITGGTRRPIAGHPQFRDQLRGSLERTVKLGLILLILVLLLLFGGGAFVLTNNLLLVIVVVLLVLAVSGYGTRTRWR